MSIEYLHVYGQYVWHDDVQIVGTRAAIERLHEILGAVLEADDPPEGTFFCGDGEGYEVTVTVRDDDDRWPKYLLPYEADYAQSKLATLDPRTT